MIKRGLSLEEAFKALSGRGKGTESKQSLEEAIGRKSTRLNMRELKPEIIKILREELTGLKIYAATGRLINTVSNYDIQYVGLKHLSQGATYRFLLYHTNNFCTYSPNKEQRMKNIMSKITELLKEKVTDTEYYISWGSQQEGSGFQSRPQYSSYYVTLDIILE